jgi:hypothetical protein
MVGVIDGYIFARSAPSSFSTMNKPPLVNAISAVYAGSRFSLPLTVATNAPGVPDSESAILVPGLPISKELVGLTEEELDSQIIPRTFWRKKSLTGKSLVGESGSDEDEEREKEAWRKAGRGVTFNSMGGGTQSSGQQGNQRHHAPLRSFDNEKEVATLSVGETSLNPFSHIESLAARLPERCAEHYSMRGGDAMRSFLSAIFIMLLPGVIRDLAAKLQLLKATLPRLDSSHTLRPTTEVCEKFQAVMRPVCDRYLTDVFSLMEARAVLCSAQNIMIEEVRQGSAIDPQLRRIMVETLNPLLAILILACLSRPGQIHRSRDTAFTGVAS